MDKEQLTTMVQGTLGYLDPEYYNTGLLNEKSDVYSFGVVLMELLSGQKALCFERPQYSKHLVSYLASAIKENRLHEIIDGKMLTEDNKMEIKEVAGIAVECTRLMGEERPKMKEVAAELEGLRVTKDKHKLSDQYPEETEQLVGVQILSARGCCTTDYDSIKNVATLHIEAGLRGILTFQTNMVAKCTSNSTIHKHNCSDPSTCRNKDGGFYCKCRSGYRLDTTNMSCKRKDFGWATILLGTTIGFLSVLLVISSVQQRRKQKKNTKLRQQFFTRNGGGMLIQRLSGAGLSNVDFKIITEEAMKGASNGYDKRNILGQGGQGTVYKGILPDNSIVAIKKSRLVDRSQMAQFINEVLVLSQINHRNVVKLLGCCLETEVPLLVYEFVTNGTLSDHLHGSMSDSSLTWEQRLRIAVEIAGSLAYLHSSASIPIIHRDVKTANILLDENLTAKVADFGASSLIPMDKDQLITMVQGTVGYLDPEYYNTGLLNEKSDVYSFGVVLMELLSGQKALCFDRSQQSKHLGSYFASAMKENRLHEVIDDKVINENNWREIEEAARVAMECTRVTGEERPLMKEVAAKLEGLRVARTKHQWSDQYHNETENLISVEILSAQENTSSSGYDSINNVARLHIKAGR
ncbi:hypothetical protein DY000_02055261 [Brassica cretica]|uniref:Protein kinase domain-containing protein n=1 Tax=Brassica cretica TaxID=69181 RepID=A0ABQ7AML1_BRACR|nr:hypothetical protein DY000_02055261 [Brassica cretica]